MYLHVAQRPKGCQPLPHSHSADGPGMNTDACKPAGWLNRRNDISLSQPHSIAWPIDEHTGVHDSLTARRQFAGACTDLTNSTNQPSDGIDTLHFDWSLLADAEALQTVSQLPFGLVRDTPIPVSLCRGSDTLLFNMIASHKTVMTNGRATIWISPSPAADLLPKHTRQGLPMDNDCA